MRAGQASYTSSTRNAITSSSFGSWVCSYAVVSPACATGATECNGVCADVQSDALHCGRCGNACPTGSSCVAGRCGAPAIDWSANATSQDCSRPGVIGTRLTYTCAAGGTFGAVWGTDIYTHDSSICTAAVHVGRITRAAGGEVTIEMRAGQASYTSSTRNGVTSASYGAWGCSFAFP
jgi:hypothetical protein